MACWSGCSGTRAATSGTSRGGGIERRAPAARAPGRRPPRRPTLAPPPAPGLDSPTVVGPAPPRGLGEAAGSPFARVAGPGSGPLESGGRVEMQVRAVELGGGARTGAGEAPARRVSARAAGVAGSEILRIAAEIRELLARGEPVCNLTV